MAAWYTYPRIDNYGAFPDPDGPFPKPDSNIAVPDGVPITALLSGVVSGVNSPDGSVPAWGAVVTVKLDNPINQQATYAAYLHLASTTVVQGQRVAVGDTLGIAGPDAMGLRWRVGFAFQSGPYYGFGAGFSNPGSAALNPVPFLDSVKSGTVIASGSGIIASLLGTTTALTNTVQNIGSSVHKTLNTVPGFLGIVDALDEIEQFQPLQLTDASKGTSINIFGLDTGIPDPTKMLQVPQNDMQALIVFTVVNGRAFLIRALLVAIGLIIAIALVMNATGLEL